MNSSENSDYENYIRYLFSTKDIIENVFNIASPAIGIPCNLISIFIFARLMNNNKNNMGFLYVWQCSIDLILILFTILLLRSGTTLGVELRNQYQWGCKSILVLRSILLHSSSWINVLTTFDRFTFVLYGHANRFRFLKKKRYLTYMILMIFTISVITATPNLFFYIKHGRIERFCSADIMVKISSDIVFILFRAFIPLMIMLVFNIIMIRKIIGRSKSMAHQSAYSRKERQFTIAVIAFDVFFFVVNLPLSLFHIFFDVNYLSGHFNLDLFQAKYILVAVITNNLALCEQSFSLFMFFAFNKLFRRELLDIVGRVFGVQSLIRQRSVRRSQPMIAFILT